MKIQIENSRFKKNSWLGPLGCIYLIGIFNLFE